MTCASVLPQKALKRAARRYSNPTRRAASSMARCGCFRACPRADSGGGRACRRRGQKRLRGGGSWFSPPAFQSPWLKIVGMDEATMRGGLPRAIAVDIVGSLVMAFVLVHAVVY